MKQKVIIKSNKYGLIVHMDPDAEYSKMLQRRIRLKGGFLQNHRKKRSLV